MHRAVNSRRSAFVIIALTIFLLGAGAMVLVRKPFVQSSAVSHETVLVTPMVAVGPVHASFLPGSRLTAVWANEGGDKVTRDELRASRGMSVTNSIWNGSRIRHFGARNEIVSINLVLESANDTARNLRVAFDELQGPDRAKISSRQVGKNEVFAYTGRNIELFLVKYLQIRGLSRLAYEPSYDERHVPLRFRLPYTLPKGTSKGLFEDRPDANKYYPDIAVPMEAVESFTIKKGENQSVWIDVYIPKTFPAGLYRGAIAIREDDRKTLTVPVEIDVLPFSLPDAPAAKTMVYISEPDINYRYTGVRWDDSGAATPQKRAQMLDVWNKHHLLAHRHKISLINEGTDPPNTSHWKMQRWLPVFSGELFTAKNGYDGPGVGVSGGVYSIGTYGSWRNKKYWPPDSEAAMRENTDRWVRWFQQYAPNVQYFLYLLDEPKAESFLLVEKWASWVKNNPGPGAKMKTLVTSSAIKQSAHMPSVDISFIMWGDADIWRQFIERSKYREKRFWCYNGWRPATGTFMIEDDGIALRMLGWTQVKHKAERWFYWASTSYKHPSRVNYETDVFERAQTFGRAGDTKHPKFGETGPECGNGDGVLFYPGTDTHFQHNSFGLPGPIASLRVKLWRRGIQDADYLTMAAKKNPEAVAELMRKMIPRTMWEVGVSNPKDPTYVHADISWSINPDDWENARRQLADIIMNRGGGR